MCKLVYSFSPFSLLLFHFSAVSKAKILGNSELFIKSGSDINLTCVALQSPAPPSFIYWYKGGRVVNYSQRGGISVLTERQTKTSKLVIARAMPSDSGNYTCSPSSSGEFCGDCGCGIIGMWICFCRAPEEHTISGGVRRRN